MKIIKNLQSTNQEIEHPKETIEIENKSLEVNQPEKSEIKESEKLALKAKNLDKISNNG